MRVYIAGPLTTGDLAHNKAQARDAANWLLDRGHQPFVPHLATELDDAQPRDYERWIQWCMCWLGQCEALLRLPGESPGADREVARARELGLFVKLAGIGV